MVFYFVDLDGTIIDPKAGMVDSFRKALQETGYGDLASRDLDWIIGPPVISSFEALLGSSSQAKEALRRYRHHYAVGDGLFDFQIYPGVLEAVTDLRADGQVFICTMKPTAFAGRILERLGICDSLLGADLDGEIRQKDQILQRAVHDLVADPADCLVIGDRGTDMAAARRTGMRALGVTWGYGTPAELGDAGAHDLCHRSADLAQAARRALRA
jgi:phosphoglycolate phosphatase